MLKQQTVLATWSVGLLAFLNVNHQGAVVFDWFMNITTVSGYVAWAAVLVVFLRFRAAMRFRGLEHTLPFRAPLQPYASWFVLGLLVLLTLTNGFQYFFPGQWDVEGFLAAYITIPFVLVLYLGHKLWFRTGLARKVQDIDVVTGVREMEQLEAMEPEVVPKNRLQKIWFYIA